MDAEFEKKVEIDNTGCECRNRRSSLNRLQPLTTSSTSTSLKKNLKNLSRHKLLNRPQLTAYPVDSLRSPGTMLLGSTSFL